MSIRHLSGIAELSLLIAVSVPPSIPSKLPIGSQFVATSVILFNTTVKSPIPMILNIASWYYICIINAYHINYVTQNKLLYLFNVL